MTNYYIADTHFGHDNVRSYDKEDRFATKEERDTLIINNWNNTVGMEDNIYILSPFGYYVVRNDNILRNVYGDDNTYIPITEIQSNVDGSILSVKNEEENLLNKQRLLLKKLK